MNRGVPAVRFISSLAAVWVIMLLSPVSADPREAQARNDVLGPIIIRSSRIESPHERTPASVSVLSVDAIHDGRQQLGLDEPLAQVPGVFALNRYNFAQDTRIAIRGFGARANFGIRGIRIFIDGIPATLPDGQSGVDAIDLGSVERMEVIRGPSASLYGAASGGVISLFTRDGKDMPGWRIGSAFGGHGYFDSRVDFGGDASNAGYRLSLSRTVLDGFRDHAASERALFTSRFRFEPDPDTELTLLLDAVDAPVADDPGGLTAAEARANPAQAAPLHRRFDAGESVSQQKLGVVVERRLGSADRLRVRNYFVLRRFENKLPFSAVSFDRIFAGGGVEYRRDGVLLGLDNRFLAGFDLDYQDDDRTRRVNADGAVGELTASQRERVSSAGVFFRNRLDISRDLTMTAGARYDKVRFNVDDRFLADGDDSGNITFSELSPSLGFTYTLSPAVRFYSSLAWAFETPTTTELANPSGGGGVNAALESQRAVSIEGGVRGRLGGITHYEIAAFHTEVDDQLVPFEIPSSPGRFAFENAGSAIHRGIEVGAQVDLLPGLKAGVAYTYSDFTFDEFRDRSGTRLDGRRIPGIPEHLLNLHLRRGWPSGAFLSGSARLVGPFFADNENFTRVGGYAVADVRAGFERSFGAWNLSAHAGINNLLDKRYNANVRINAGGGRFFEPAPGRNFYTGITLRRGF